MPAVIIALVLAAGIAAAAGGVLYQAATERPSAASQVAQSPAATAPTASPATPATNPAADAAHALLAEAIRTLETRDTVTAKLRHEVNLFGQHLVGSGVYYEQRPGRDNLLRMEMRLQLGDQTSSLVTVCDGRYLWEHRNLPSKAELVRIDVIRAMRALQRGEEPLTAAKPTLLPGLGGLPRLLRGLQTHWQFAAAQPGQWGAQKEPAWRLQGTWTKAQLLRLLPAQAEQIEQGRPDLSRLPPYIPDTVVIYLGQRDQFPYRVEFRRQAPDKDGEPCDRLLVSVDFYEIAVNEPIDRTQFVYSPPSDTEFSDETESFVQSLKAKR